MAQLILRFKNVIRATYPLGSAEITIGRLPGNTVVIDNLAVSRRHARIVREDETYFLEDLASYNGVFVNGEKITRRPLGHGDVIVIGKHVLEFRVDGAAVVESEGVPLFPDGQSLNATGGWDLQTLFTP
ncbi:MAG: FHA domain-containing protein, partial [Magnetococcales bacterium]|nr:FHA domain-containing protein [Magnetococcales bacterium]